MKEDFKGLAIVGIGKIPLLPHIHDLGDIQVISPEVVANTPIKLFPPIISLEIEPYNPNKKRNSNYTKPKKKRKKK